MFFFCEDFGLSSLNCIDEIAIAIGPNESELLKVDRSHHCGKKVIKFYETFRKNLEISNTSFKFSKFLKIVLDLAVPFGPPSTKRLRKCFPSKSKSPACECKAQIQDEEEEKKVQEAWHDPAWNVLTRVWKMETLWWSLYLVGPVPEHAIHRGRRTFPGVGTK